MFGRRSKKETEELKKKYGDLEGKYEELSADHHRLKEETGERTSMRISAIEEEIESMNARVEKLATDSYAIHSELREIGDSVTEMHRSLKEIVQLYKAILTQYGTAQMKAQARERLAQTARRPDESPGDSVIRQLKAEQERTAARREGVRARAGNGQGPGKGLGQGPGPLRASPQATQAPPPPRTPPPSSSPPPSTAQPSALDELHRVEAEEREQREQGADPLAPRTPERGTDRVDRVARRDMDRDVPIRGGTEEGFLRSLPRKTVQRRPPADRTVASGEGWEETGSPTATDAEGEGG